MATRASFRVRMGHYHASNKKPPILTDRGFPIWRLAVTYSHTGTPALPSAIHRFTAEFGMGSGGSNALLPPGKPFETLASHRKQTHRSTPYILDNSVKSYYCVLRSYCISNFGKAIFVRVVSGHVSGVKGVYIMYTTEVPLECSSRRSSRKWTKPKKGFGVI